MPIKPFLSLSRDHAGRIFGMQQCENQLSRCFGLRRMQARSVPLLAFCSTSRQWVPSASLGASTSTSTLTSNIQQTDDPLTVLTYNVYSGRASSHIPKPALRTKAAIALLRRSRGDVLALQEVSLPFEAALRKERWLRDQYAISSLSDYFLVSTDGQSDKLNNRGEAEEGGDEGCLLCIRRSLLQGDHTASMTRLPGQQGKVIVSVVSRSGVSYRPEPTTIVTNGCIQTRFTTSHFESLADNAHIRRQQFSVVASLLEDGRPLVMLGDCNHSTYGELDGLVAASNFGTPACFVDVQASRNSPSTPEQLLRHQPTFGELYPYFAGSREKRKARRSDLILHSREHFSALQCWTDGAKAIEQAPQKHRRGDNAHGQGENQQRPRKLRCAQGKGGFACELKRKSPRDEY